MRFVFSSYVYTPAFNEPETWLARINAYAGIHHSLSKTHEVISIEQIDFEGQYRNGAVDYRFKRFSKYALRFFPLRLHLYIKNLKPDVVVIHGLHFPLQVIQLRLLLGKNAKIIVQNHAEKPFKGVKKYLQQWADHFIDAYLFASRPMGLEWVTAGNLRSPGKIHEVMEVSSVFYPVDKSLAKQATGVQDGPVFLWVGRLNLNKDPLTVVNAFLKFAETTPAAKLYMIYHTGELLSELQALLATNPAYAATVILIGKIPHAELLSWFNSADYIISGSHYEGSGAAICEAMSCGCIPLVTDIHAFRMITDDGRCGILYEAGNQDALLIVLAQTRQLDVSAQRKLTMEYYRTNLSFEAIASKIQEIASSV